MLARCLFQLYYITHQMNDFWNICHRNQILPIAPATQLDSVDRHWVHLRCFILLVRLKQTSKFTCKLHTLMMFSLKLIHLMDVIIPTSISAYIPFADLSTAYECYDTIQHKFKINNLYHLTKDPILCNVIPSLLLNRPFFVVLNDCRSWWFLLDRIY